MRLIDGKAIAANVLESLKSKVAALPFKPIFCDLLVGDNPRSILYVKRKGQAAEHVGIEFRFAHFPEQTDTETLVATLKAYSQEARMSGIIVQLPLPERFSPDDRRQILDAVSVDVDVDCLSTEGKDAFYASRGTLLPPTAGAVMHLLSTVPIQLKGLTILVIGQGDLVGKPVAHLLRTKGLHVITADKYTSEEDLKEYLLTADVIISGTGQHNLFTGDTIKKGVVILDAGTTAFGGDLDQRSLADKPSYLSPVPGGVGPVTVAMLMQNVVQVAQQKAQSKV